MKKEEYEYMAEKSNQYKALANEKFYLELARQKDKLCVELSEINVTEHMDTEIRDHFEGSLKELLAQEIQAIERKMEEL
jgi:hypothetical protein